MKYVALLHTRSPFDEFVYTAADGIDDDVDSLDDAARKKLFAVNKDGRVRVMSGMWGAMALLVGGLVRVARFDKAFATEDLKKGETEQVVLLNARKVYLAVTGKVAVVKYYTTMERYRTKDGSVDKYNIGYVRMVGSDEPYGLKAEMNNKNVKALRQDHDGACLRVLGGKTAPQRGILIHEAPHVGWLTGCISPRPHLNRGVFENKPGNPSDVAFREILRMVQSNGGVGRLFVLRG